MNNFFFTNIYKRYNFQLIKLRNRKSFKVNPYQQINSAECSITPV